MTRLSEKAIQDLRNELIRVYDSDFGLQNGDLNEIGLFLLTTLSEGLKLQKMLQYKRKLELICTDK